ncbi:hypothetical protein GQ457_10G023590 [Hibiscus cannabinus]
MERKVGIIGAGVSGLLACKCALSKGFHPIVFESQSTIGGVWTNALETTKLQTPKPLYQFSYFTWPPSVTQDFPDKHLVFDYVKAYAKHFDLLQHIKFNTKVSGIEYKGHRDEEIRCWSLWGGTGEPFSSMGKWKLIVQDLNTLSTQIYQVDFVIICVVRFSGLPNIPEFPPNKGPEAFHEKVVHSMDYADMEDEKAAEFIKGKRVVVVGFQKSALDIAMECYAANGEENPCTVLYRTPRWNLPDAAIPLYRECIQPRIPQLAVIGYSKSVANLYTSEIRCRWLAELLDGTFKLPSIREMEEDVRKWEEYLKKYSGGNFK